MIHSCREMTRCCASIGAIKIRWEEKCYNPMKEMMRWSASCRAIAIRWEERPYETLRGEMVRWCAYSRGLTANILGCR